MGGKFFVTGAAGFIGFHLCKRLIEQGVSILGFDNLNNYYDVKLKKNRLSELEKISKTFGSSWKFIKGDLENKKDLEQIITSFKPNIIVNLAAQAGVRFSIENPSRYINSNIVGFGNLLEIAKNNDTEHIIYASSSSVYGGNSKIPFSEKDPVDNPVSIYAATKKANELMAYSYSHLYNIPITGIRFFTVYGPWGRPDMAPMIFTKAMLSSEPIYIFNKGEMYRDFTYIDDVIDSLVKIIDIPPEKTSNNKNERKVPNRIVNIGHGNPIKLTDFIEILEKELDLKSKKIFKNMQMGDVKRTYADTTFMEQLIVRKEPTSLKEGINKFINWYKRYYS